MVLIFEAPVMVNAQTPLNAQEAEGQIKAALARMFQSLGNIVSLDPPGFSATVLKNNLGETVVVFHQGASAGIEKRKELVYQNGEIRQQEVAPITTMHGTKMWSVDYTLFPLDGARRYELLPASSPKGMEIKLTGFKEGEGAGLKIASVEIK